MHPKNRDCLLGEEVVICNTVASDRSPVNMAKHSNSKPHKAASNRATNTKSHGKEKAKNTRENNSKRTKESKQSRNR